MLHLVDQRVASCIALLSAAEQVVYFCENYLLWPQLGVNLHRAAAEEESLPKNVVFLLINVSNVSNTVALKCKMHLQRKRLKANSHSQNISTMMYGPHVRVIQLLIVHLSLYIFIVHVVTSVYEREILLRGVSMIIC